MPASVHVCASASHCRGPYPPWRGNYVCVFIFPNPAAPSPNVPWQLLSTRQAGSAPSPPRYPAPPRRGPDASQLVGRLRSPETDARAAVGARLRIGVRGQPWAPAVTFHCWKRLQEVGVAGVAVRARIKVPQCHLSPPVCCSLRASLTARNLGLEITSSSQVMSLCWERGRRFQGSKVVCDALMKINCQVSLFNIFRPGFCGAVLPARSNSNLQRIRPQVVIAVIKAMDYDLITTS